MIVVIIITASIATVMTAIFIAIFRYTSQLTTKVKARTVSTMVVLGSGDL